jgi:hypothetical protein
MKTSELTGVALDWAVATANGDYPQWDAQRCVFYAANGADMDYSTSWALAGPIIEANALDVCPYDPNGVGWRATTRTADYDKPAERQYGAMFGPTPLIAAMRCFVASKLGNTVELPKELT